MALDSISSCAENAACNIFVNAGEMAQRLRGRSPSAMCDVAPSEVLGARSNSDIPSPKTPAAEHTVSIAAIRLNQSG